MESTEDDIARLEAMLAAWDDVQRGVPRAELVRRYGWIHRDARARIEAWKSAARGEGWEHFPQDVVA
ncbi:MAG TPA: hypothetical protein VF821_09395 [Lentzea sp.]